MFSIERSNRFDSPFEGASVGGGGSSRSDLDLSFDIQLPSQESTPGLNGKGPAPGPVNEDRVLLGKGRSGAVYRVRDADGTYQALKRFDSEGLQDAVQRIFSGSVNPYRWNEHAIKCADLRRRILSELCGFWTDGKLEVANSHGHSWNEDAKAFELVTDYVEGRTPSLHHPFSGAREHEVADLKNDIMKPLQAKLRESGFDGMLWQAGKGNPVALNNFLLSPNQQGQIKWHWIDLESGVPALFAMNPISSLSFYLPKSFKHKRPLFDDVDIEKLNSYLSKEDAVLREKLGPERMAALLDNVAELAVAQKDWKATGRVENGVTASERLGKISSVEASFYRDHQLRWLLRETKGLFRDAAAVARRGVGEVWGKIRSTDWKHKAQKGVEYFKSRQSRMERIQQVVDDRIRVWEKRGQLTGAEAEELRTQLKSFGVDSYLPDFAAHVGIWAGSKLFEKGVFPSLLVAGQLSVKAFVFWELAAGPILRTAYSLSQLPSTKKPLRMIFPIAFGAIPMVGNFAYLLQTVVYDRDKASLAAFVMYDTAARFGEKLPIWGGKDTATEHFCNRLVDLVVWKRKPLAPEGLAEGV